MTISFRIAGLVATSAMLLAFAYSDDEFHESILAQLSSGAHAMISTIPKNGDLNPYGVAFVSEGFREGGTLERGDILVSNFNSSANLQGTGTKIVRITAKGETSVFFEGKPPLGLTTALGVLSRGFVVVGNLPATTGTPQQGSLLILNRSGSVAANLTSASLLNGPWDLAIHDEGGRAQVFVSNVLSGSVTRLDLAIADDSDKPGAITVSGMTQIASGYVHRLDANALVVGPTGLAYDVERDVLFVASTGDNMIFAIPNARAASKDGGPGIVAYKDNTHLHGPLGLLLAPNGNLIAANGDAVNPDPSASNELVEFTPAGTFVSQFQLDMGNSGAAFGIAIARDGNVVRFAAVDDNQNNLNIWTIR